MPNVAFNFINACEGEDTRFFNLSTISSGELSYAWDFDDEQSSQSKSPIHRYERNGKYGVELIATSAFGCRDTLIDSVASYALPIIDIEESISTCEDEFLLDAGNEGASYAWQDNSSQQTFNVTETGGYSVEVTTEQGCKASLITQVTLNSTFSPSLLESVTACDSVTLDAGNASAQSYLWSTGANTRTIVVASSGEYTVEIVDQNGCIGKDTVNVIINSSPIVNLGEDASFCADSVPVLDAQNTGASYLWSTGSTSQSIPITATGTYSVKVTSPEACYASDTVHYSIHALPVVDLGEDGQACDMIALDAGNEGASYLWSDGSTAQTFSTTTSGTYSVEVTDANACVASDTTTLTVVANPVYDLGDDIALCAGEFATLDASINEGTYLWSDGSTSATLLVTASGDFSVAVSNSLGCVVTDSITVTVNPLVNVDLGENQEICGGDTVNNYYLADAGIAGASYLWTGMNTGFAASEQQAKLTQQDTYAVEVTTAQGCKGSDTLFLNVREEVLEARFLSASYDTLHIKQEQTTSFNFINLSIPDTASFLWKFGDGYQSTNTDELHTYFVDTSEAALTYKEDVDSISYEVSLSASIDVCAAEVAKTITIYLKDTTLAARMILPNVGGDAEEDIQKVEIAAAKTYPNPTENIFKLEITLSKEGKVYLTLTDMAGLVLDQQEYDNILELNKEYDLANQASGMYLLHITTPQDERVMRIVKK